MKIKVSQLEANPFRNLPKYPFDKEKVAALKTSINETSFWDNILARPNSKGKYQIAYGHHRWKALKELGVKEVDIPVRKLDDATMLQIMANENMEAWGLSPMVVNETVMATKRFLDVHVAKYSTLKEFNAQPGGYNRLVSSENNFQKAKQGGVGHGIILAFLGGNWKDWMIKESLSTLSKPEVFDRKAIETLPKMEAASKFKKAVVDYNIPKKKQLAIAKKIVKDGIGKRDIAAEVSKARPKVKERDTDLKRIEREFWRIEEKANSLQNTIVGFNLEMEKLSKAEVGGVQALVVAGAIKELFEAIKVLFGFLGIKAIVKGALK